MKTNYAKTRAHVSVCKTCARHLGNLAKKGCALCRRFFLTTRRGAIDFGARS